MEQMPNKYDPKEAEPRWTRHWEEHKTYAFDQESDKEIFSIDTPPPTVSGRMHLGHAFSYSQIDFVARFNRMFGKNVYFPFGTDDNGLATEKLVQKSKGLNLRKVDRKEAVQIVLDFLKEERPKFIQDWKDTGISSDFSKIYSTIDEYSRKISQKTFLDLVKKDRVYRKRGPVMWDRVFQTAIAQAELEDLQRTSTLSYVKAKIEGTDNTFMIYATTRPELAFAVLGMSIEDEGDYVKLKVGDEFWITGAKTYEEKFKDFTYEVTEHLKGQDLIGEKVHIPVVDRVVEISHDIAVKADFGTGIAYFCSYGGLEDIEWVARHEVQPIEVLDTSGRLTEKGGKYEGKLAEEARKEIIADMVEAGHIIMKEQKEQTVNIGERSGAEVEYIVSQQWYIKYLDLKEHFWEQAQKFKWTPSFMKHRIENWIEGLNWDWGVSRQRHFGVPIPVWYDKEGNTYYADEAQLPVDPTVDRPLSAPSDIELIPETDVFDTWFTSASSPDLARNLHGPQLAEKMWPMTLRPQSHDIINFWLFYTMAKNNLLYDANPFEHVNISGWVLDPKGKKMSKSKGNVIEPQKMIEKFSADAIRYAAAATKLGDDQPFQEKELVTGTKTVTKLWNSSRFTYMHLEEYQPEQVKVQLMDRWLLTKLHRTINASTEAFKNYDYARARFEVDQLFWKVYCDNYLEVVKDRLYNPDRRGQDARASAQAALEETLGAILKMFAPIIPYITEEIYSYYYSTKEGHGSIHTSDWPAYDETRLDENAERIGDIVINVINQVRRAKSEQNLSLKNPVKKIILEAKMDQLAFDSIEEDLKGATGAELIEFTPMPEGSEKDLDCVIEL